MGSHRWSTRSPGEGAFQNGLTVSEDALASAGGLVPLLPVTGVDVRSVSIALPLPRYRQTPFVASPRPDEEFAEDVRSVDVLDEQVTTARHHAFSRLREQAADIGADAVIGIRQIEDSALSLPGRADLAKTAARLRPGPHPYVSRIISHQVVGTAVRDPVTASQPPALSCVSPAESWRLRDAGFRAVDVVGGCGHCFGASLWTDSAGHEIQGSTAVWKAARQAAFAQLGRELGEITADGVIGVTSVAVHELFDWTERVQLLGRTDRTRVSRVARQGLLVSITVQGTAVRRFTEPTRRDQPVLRTLDLS